MAKIQLNGKKITIKKNLSILNLLKKYNLNNKKIAIEFNGIIIPKLNYKKKYLPVVVLDKLENWRKIKDFENNSGWIHTSQLSKRKSAINIKNNSVIYKKPTLYSKPIARLEIGRLIIIKKCENKWCKVITGDISGWVLKNTLWGMV